MSLSETTVTLSKVKPWKNKWTIEVKTGETLEMVLSDKEGVKIHASCKKTHFGLLERHCRVGTWIFITNFTLGTPFGGFRLTKHVYKMSFMTGTKISPSPLQNDDIFLDLVDFDTLLSGTHNADILIGEEKKKVEFTLRDIKFAKLGKYRGKYIVVSDPENVISVVKHIHAENCRLIAIVYSIDTDWAWCYFACVPCNKRAFKMTNGKVPTWWCEGCSRTITKVAPNKQSKLLLLDSVASKILNVEATEILNGSLDEIEDPELLPNEIRSLIGKSYGFGISVEDPNVNYGVDAYKTAKVWSLEDAGNTVSVVDSLDQSEKETTLMSGEEVSLRLTDTSGSSETLSTPSKRAL
ncbi:hypothetical protein N665_0040s0079 [Sinapis alba]|nr:hypothetical protein N665_0040s0079 [Sinapis alba]